MRIYSLVLTLLLLSGVPAHAAEDFYHFDSEQTRSRFENLTTNLRCLVCQNQNLAESNAPLANDLRTQVYQKIQSGQSDQDIIDYLVARYGDFILYQPPLRAATALLWGGPLLFLLGGSAYLLVYLRRHRESAPS